MEIVTPLGDNVLLFHGMHAREELGRLSEYQIDLLSERGDVDVNAILGKPVGVKLEQAEDGTRFFNGVVTRFSQRGMIGRYHRYGAVVRPWFWLLTRTADCRIFQDMTVPDIVKKVFEDHAAADVRWEITGTYRKWTYCVQYRETDFNFVSRLLEHEGIYYYFVHTDGHHTMVVADSYSGHAPCTPEEIDFIDPAALVRPEYEHIYSWDVVQEIQPGAYVHTDYDLERPSVNLKTQKTLPRGYSPSDYEVFDYPGHYIQKPDGEQYAGVRIDEYGTQFETTHGATNLRSLAVGLLFTLKGHAREDQNREHLVVAASYDLTFDDYEALPGGTGASYGCNFTAMASQQQFRPKRATPKPFVQGPQTAVVVGPSGDEIHTDEFGRVKVQFHWDRRGEKNENSSCWIRVSHPWAGKGWGAVATPRIGQEVIVDFLEGDPDQPIITGRVYNAEQQPPFGFPAGAVLSGVKSDTHKGNGFNELSMDDTAGKERVFIHGQYNMDTVVEHDQTSTIHNNRTDRVDVDDSESVGNNQTWDVGANRDASIHANETLTVDANRTKSVGGNETITVTGNRDGTVNGSETLTVALQRTHTVGINETISVGAAQEITVGAMQAITVGANQTTNVGANQTIGVGANISETAGSNISSSAGSDMTLAAGAKFSASAGSDFTGSAGGKMALSAGSDFSVNGGAKGVIDIANELTLQCGSASIILKSGGDIIIDGKNIIVTASGKVSVEASGEINMKGSQIKGN